MNKVSAGKRNSKISKVLADPDPAWTSAEPFATDPGSVKGRAISAKPEENLLGLRRTVTAHVQSETRVADRRERIISAAIKVFHRQGFHNATTADVAREAGLGQSNLYNYVKSKQDILFLVCDHLVGMYEAVLRDVCALHDDPYVRIVEALRAIIDVMTTYQDELQLLYHETHALEKADRMVILGSVSQFIGRLEILIEEYEQSTQSSITMGRRLAASLMSFVPAMIPLRSWDLRVQKKSDIENAILSFTLRGFGIPERTREKP